MSKGKNKNMNSEPKKEEVLVENNNDCVTSVTEYLERVSRLTDDTGRYIFRGLSSEDYKLESHAKRKIKGSDKTKVITTDEFVSYHEQMIDDFKAKGHQYKNGRKLSIFEMLAEVQHFGGSTLLMDFSRNALVALYFASQEKRDKNGKLLNGIVYLAKESDPYKFKQLDKKKASSYSFEESFENLFESKINDKKSLLTKQPVELVTHQTLQLDFWEAGLQNQRIPAQHSVFILDIPYFPKHYFVSICIKKDSKDRIIQELKNHFDIHGLSLFNDIPGFAKYFTFEGDHMKEIREQIISLIQISKFKNALKILKEYIHNKPNDFFGYSKRGYIFYQTRKFDEAIKDFDIAIKLKPDDFKTYDYRGNAKDIIHDHEGAIKDYNKAIELKPDFAEAYYDRGIAKVNLKSDINAIKDYEKAIELIPNFPNAYSNLGNIKLGQEREKEAISNYNKAIELKPDFTGAYYNRGLAKFKIGDFEGAIRDCTMVIKLDPYFTHQAYTIRGDSYKALGDTKKAELDFARAKELHKQENYPKIYAEE